MKKQWVIVAAILAFLAVVFSFILLNIQKKYKTAEPKNQPFLENLAQKIPAFNRITFSFNDQNIILVKEGDHWIVQDKNYRADQQKLNKFLLDLSESQFIEEKTNQSDRFDKLGLNSSSSVKLSIVSSDTDQPIVFNVGKYTEALNGTYVKLEQQNHAWLVSGNFDANQLKTSWLDYQPFSILRDQVKQYRLLNPARNQTILELSKSHPEQQAFDVAWEGKTLSSQDIKQELIYSFTSIWQDFKFANVQLAADLENPVAEESIEITTFAGLIIKAQLFKAKEQYWVSFFAEKAPQLSQLIRHNKDKQVADGLTSDSLASNNQVSEKEAVDEASDQLSDTAVDDLINKINSYQSWVYMLDSFKTSLFKQKQADVLQAKPLTEQK